MHIGIASPISIQKFRIFLNPFSQKKSEYILGLKAPAVDTLALGLLESNHRISIYTLSYEVKSKLILNGENLTIYINPLRKQGWKRAITFFDLEAKQIKENIESENIKPDILHAHWSYEYAKGVLYFKNKIPTFVTVRDWAPTIFKYYPDYYRFFRLLLNNNILKQDKVNFIANSQYIQSKLKRRWRKNSGFIPNPINSSFINTNQFEKHKEQFLISVSNNINKAKNIEKLLKAFKLVLVSYPNLKLMLIGSQFISSNVQIKKWAKLRLLENVELLGCANHNELISYYDKASIMVHPSLEESFGNTVIEAMARKVAVIGGEKSGAVPYLLQNGKNGLLVDVKSINSIKEGIVYLLSNESERNKYAENAYNFVINKFDSKEIVNQTLMLYNKVLNK